MSSPGPGFERTTLDNGLRVVTSSMSHTRSVTLSVYVGVGSRYEPDDRAGISHVVEHLVFKGTERRPRPIDISGGVEGVGGVLNASTEHEMTVYWSKVALPYLEETLDLLIDMVRNSVYDREELERELHVVIEEQKMVNDQPSGRVDALMEELLWPGHPLGRDIAGTSESVSGITREMVMEHVGRFYTPDNIVVSVAGNVEHGHVVELAESMTRGWRPGKTGSWEPFSGRGPQSRVRVETRRTEQSHLAIGLPGVALGHPDRYAVEMLSVALGEGMSSRLFVEVREKRGLAYDIHSSTAHFQDCGALVMLAGVDPQTLHEAVRTIIDVAAGMAETLTEDEVERARRMHTGMLALSMEDSRVVSAWMGAQELLFGRILDVDAVVERVNEVGLEDVRRAARDLLRSDQLRLAVVGPHRGSARLQRALRF